jgi:Rps23 Pro-64 3,4-dihydroxylase Tpa1-like proline 4-hydroxylase
MSIPALSDEKWSKSLSLKSLVEDFPFPHLIIDDFLETQKAKSLRDVFPDEDDSWVAYLHYNEKKYGLSKRNNIPDPILSTIDELNSPKFLKWLGNTFGLNGLIADPELNGGGLHLMKQGGYLNIHTDFNVHPNIHHLKRRINLIVFFNEDWPEEYNGALEFWPEDLSACATKIMPKFNRCVIFETNDKSYHGCPEILTCPKNTSRKSLALYYYTYEDNKPRKKFTNYKSTKNTLINNSLVYLDKKLVHIYSFIKYNTKLNDGLAGKILRFFK